MAKKNGWKVIDISLRATNADRHRMFYEAGVEEFLSLVKHAEYVVTNSFHGTAFSIIFNKQFAVRQVWNTSRVKTLLANVNLCDRFLETKEQIVQLNEIDYNLVNQAMGRLLNDSYEYINNNLK